MNNKAILKTARSKSNVKPMFRPKVNITRIVARREEVMESMASRDHYKNADAKVTLP